MRLLPSLPDKPRHGDVLLINPRYARNPCSSAGRHALAPALALPLLAAVTPAGYSVRLWDENLELGEIPSRPVPEVVGITVHTAFAHRAYELADQLRRTGARVVLGGLHVTALPREARAHADVVVVGDGVSVWPEVLAGLRNGSLRGGIVVEGSFVTPSYAAAPWPRRDVLPRGAFLTTAAVIATRGCVQRCGFCYLATRGLHAPYQRRPVSDVLAEIDALGERFVVFTDNNIVADPAYALELCRGLETRRVIWTAATTIDVARDERLVAAMAAAGCQGVFVGLETLSDANLREHHKRTLPPSSYRQAVALLHRHRIEVNGSFVFGFDDDGPDVFDRTLDFIIEERLECATFHILTPYPGTPLFQSLEAQGRILTRDWRHYDTAHVVFRPARLSAEELLDGYRRAYRRLYSWRTILARHPRGATATETVLRSAAYLTMTALYKKADWIWRALVPLRLVSACWHPLIELHYHLAARRRRDCARLADEQRGNTVLHLPRAA
jgi:radical SAM superfamily enzyme YgiQ (UPF0313 family)